MQLDIEDKVLRRDVAPSANQHRIGHGIERGIDLHHGEILRVPAKPISRAHLFWIPKLDKPGIRPAGRANKDFSSRHPAIVLEGKKVLNLCSKEMFLFALQTTICDSEIHDAGWSSLV